MRPNRICQAIIKTLSYSDVFDFPLQKRELWKFLNSRTAIGKDSFNHILDQMINTKMIQTKKGFYFLNGRKKIISTRLRRKKISSNKLGIAKKAAKILSFIPTIKLIAVSGSLSQKNAKKEDDIDFFIITKSSTLWITRFFVNILLIMTGYKRSREDSHGMNLICPNLFISEDELTLPLARRNLFSAREIAQLLTLFDRKNTYKKFLPANIWVKNYLPNTKISREKLNCIIDSGKILNFLDRIFYAFQFLYMENRITGEEIRQKAAYFHPKNKGEIILKLYKMRYKKYVKNILQDIDIKPSFMYI